MVYNYGTLSVADDYYQVEMRNSDGITFPYKRLYRIPQNTIWGYIAYDENSSIPVASSFLNELEVLAVDKNFQDGYYGYFSVLNNNLSILNEDIPFSKQTAFGYEFEGNNDNLIGLLTSFRNNYPGMEFRIFTSKGEVL